MKHFTLITLALLATACTFDPLDGDLGVVAMVPEQDSCRVRVRGHGPDGVQNTVRWEVRPCDGDGHDLEVLGRRWDP